MLSLKELKPKLKKVLRTKPRKYQALGILFLERKKGRGLIGDDMGVGKTLEVLGYLALHPELRPVVIVCPSSAKYEWEEQIYKHTKYLKCSVLESRTPYTPKIQDILIINYEILHYWETFLANLKPQLIVSDEAHALKERKTLRTLSVKSLVKKSKAFIPMSGTPIINRPVEFFTILNLLDSKNFSSFWKFAFKYCDPKPGFRGRGWDFTGASNIKELHEQVSNIMIRRTKEEVLPELPPKQRIVVPVELSNRKEYDKAHENFMIWYKENYGKQKAKKAKKAVGFVRMQKLRHLSAQGKIQEAFKWIEDFLHITEEKLVVFCYHKDIFKLLAKKYNKISCIGGKAGRKRKHEIDKFQKEKKYRLFIASVKADKEAITLTAASTTLHIEMALTPGENDQAEDRILRIGQASKSVSHYYLIAYNSIDEKVWDMVEYKRDIVSRAVDGKSAEDESKEISMKDVFKNPRQKSKTKIQNKRRK